jgi:uncharacterized protein (TIGR02001 family)
MKKTALFIAALVASGSMYAQAQQTAKPAIDLTFDATVVNEYLWRGQEQADWTLHPSLKATYGDAYLGVWSAMPFNQSGRPVDWTEFDFLGGYKFAIDDNWGLDAGITFYTYTDTPGENRNVIEPYLGVSGKIADRLSTSFYAFHAFETNQTTFQGSVGYSIPVARVGLSVDLSATLGYVSTYGRQGRTDAQGHSTTIPDYFYWSIGAAVPYKLSERALVTVGVSYNDVSENNINDDPDFIGSVSLSLGF